METLQNQQLVREIYVKLIKEHDLRIVDGNKSKKEVANEILKVVADFRSARDAR